MTAVASVPVETVKTGYARCLGMGLVMGLMLLRF